MRQHKLWLCALLVLLLAALRAFLRFVFWARSFM